MGEIAKTRRMEKDQQQHQFLPNEITIYILSRLPADSIVRFKCVCRAWQSIVEEDPVFHDMHIRGLIASSSSATTKSMGFVKLENVDNTTTHCVCFAEYKHDDDQKVMNFKRWRLPIKDDYFKIHESLTIVVSCNGLICISVMPDYYRNQSQHTTTLLVCNPLTGEAVNLSNPSINSLIHVGIGFGYLPSTNEYKIVRTYASQDGRIKHVQVYTLGSGRWRFIVPQISSSWSGISFSPTITTTRYANNHVSNLGVSVNGALYFNNRMNIEEFRIIVSPKPPPPTPPFNMDIGIGGLGVLEGRLYHYRPLGTISPPRILLQSIPSGVKGIVSYNPETDHLCCRDIDGDKRMVIPYVKSCVSLKALGETLQGKI